MKQPRPRRLGRWNRRCDRGLRWVLKESDNMVEKTRPSFVRPGDNWHRIGFDDTFVCLMVILFV